MNVLEKLKNWLNPPPTPVDVGEIKAVIYFADGTSECRTFKGSSDFLINQMYAIHSETVFRDWLKSYNKQDFVLETSTENKRTYVPTKKIIKIETVRKEYIVNL